MSVKTIERAKVNLCHFTNVSLICDDFYTYEFNTNFDIIYSSLTFMHLKDKGQAIDKVASLLNRNGSVDLSLEKNQQPFIKCGERKIEIYPDNPPNIR